MEDSFGVTLDQCEDWFNSACVAAEKDFEAAQSEILDVMIHMLLDSDNYAKAKRIMSKFQKLSSEKLNEVKAGFSNEFSTIRKEAIAMDKVWEKQLKKSEHIKGHFFQSKQKKQEKDFERTQVQTALNQHFREQMVRILEKAKDFQIQTKSNYSLWLSELVNNSKDKIERCGKRSLVLFQRREEQINQISELAQVYIVLDTASLSHDDHYVSALSVVRRCEKGDPFLQKFIEQHRYYLYMNDPRKWGILSQRDFEEFNLSWWEEQLKLIEEKGYAHGTSDGYEQGYSDGYSEGEDSGYDRGYSDGYSTGHESGYNEGHNSGYDEGYYDKSMEQDN